MPGGRCGTILRKSDGIGPVVMQNLPTGPTVRDRGRFCIHHMRQMPRSVAGGAIGRFCMIELAAKDRVAQPRAAKESRQDQVRVTELVPQIPGVDRGGVGRVQ